MTVKQIVSKYLKAHGYDGLYCPMGSQPYCYCSPRYMFMECANPKERCVLGYRQERHPGEWIIGPKQEADNAHENTDE